MKARVGAPAFVAAAVFVALATGVRLGLDPYLGQAFPFVAYFAAVAAAAFYGGLWPGIFATAVSLAAADWFFLAPRDSFALASTDLEAWAGGTLFLLAGSAIAGLIEALRRSRDAVRSERIALQNLDTQREWLRVTLASIGDAVIATDAGGRVSFMNAVAEELTGIAAGAAQGRPLKDVFRIQNELTREPVEDPCEKVLKTGRVVGLANHTVLISADGTERPIDDSAAPIQDEGGTIFGVILVFRDATEHRRSQEIVERLAAIVQYSDDAIIGKRLDGTITSWNASAERLYGFSAGEAIGRHISMIVPPDRRAELDRIMERLRRGERIDHLETKRRRKDGSVLDVSLTVSPIKDAHGEVVGASKIARDITEQKLAQDALRRSERELRISEERLRLALSAGSLGVWDWDLATDALTWSEKVFDIHGVSPSAFSGTIAEFQKLVHPEDAPRVSRAIERALEGEAPYELEFRIVRSGGETRWVSASGQVVRDEGGRPIRMLGATMDTTERKTAEENVKLLARASDTIAAHVDLESTLQALARLTVPSFADWCAFGLLDETGEIQQIARAHADPGKEPLIAELGARYPVGWENRSSSVRILETEGGAGSIQDVSAIVLDSMVRNDRHRQVLEELQLRSLLTVPLQSRGRDLGSIVFVRSDRNRPFTAADSRLARELARRAGIAVDNCRLYEDLKRADRQKDDFLAMLAHELRNPLAAIDYAVRLSTISAEQASHAGEIIQRQVRHLSRLIADLLDVSRITRDKIQLRKEPIDAAVLVNRAVGTARPFIEEHNHRLSVEVTDQEMPLFADPTRVEQIVVNLLTNAAKYTTDGGHIGVTAWRQGGEAVIKVRDDGIGIPPQMLTRVFELFLQVEPRIDRSQGGLGLGLTLVRRLTEMHGGSVSATSEGLGKGSEFTVRLPLQEREVLPRARERFSNLRPGLRVLVVEDNLDTARSVSLLLESAGCEVRTVYDGLSALETARAFQPDAVVLDIGIPGLDGYEVARRIRADRQLADVHLVAVSGYGQEKDRERSREAGFDHHLVKPVEFEVLLGILAEPREAVNGSSLPNGDHR